MADQPNILPKRTSSGPQSQSLEELKKKTKRRRFLFGAAAVTTAVASGKVGKRKKENIWITLLWALLIAAFIRTFFVEAFRIPTGSMKNTLLVGDYLFVNKLSYEIKFPRYIPLTTTELPLLSNVGIKTWGIDRGEVIVFEYPGDQDLVEPREKKVNYIKRCIGVAGDTIQVIRKQVYVNGKAMINPPGMVYREGALPEHEVDPHIFPSGAPWNRDWYGPIRVPKRGDVVQVNRDNFSRWAVFIQREGHKASLNMSGQIEIDGQVATKYTVQRDYLWMMGDNRDDSEDSRFWGYAPVDNVVGKALIIYYSRYSPPSTGYGDGYDPDEVQDSHFRWDRIGNFIH